jgi:hypothetical protein
MLHLVNGGLNQGYMLHLVNGGLNQGSIIVLEKKNTTIHYLDSRALY